MTNANLITKISLLPENLRKEVVDFIEFLETKSKSKEPEKKKRVPGTAKEMIRMKNNSDERLRKNGTHSKTRLIKDIMEAVEQVNLIKAGKLKGRSAEEFLNEL